jgi:hypothetical protein
MATAVLMLPNEAERRMCGIAALQHLELTRRAAARFSSLARRVEVGARDEPYLHAAASDGHRLERSRRKC